MYPLAARSYSPLPGRAEGVSQSAGNCVEHEDGRAVGGDAALQMWCGAILRYSFPPPHPEFVHTPCPTKALWSFKGTLNVVQANALPFLAPLLILRLALR
jgi:hypothetical protein